MADGSNVAPVIIKRKKVSAGGGHHGGAWKVAYADFVTAMMAFFMLMWLLNATTEKQRKGIADYFSPTIPMSRISGGGDGSFGGDNVFSEDALPQNGIGATNLRTTESDQARGESGVAPDGHETESAQDDFERVEEALFGRGGESMITEEALKHIVTRVTDEGLVVELFEAEGRPLFDGAGGATPLLAELSALLVDVAELVQNPLALEGHVAAVPVVLADDPVWPRSIARADLMRDLLLRKGLDPHRVERVTGHADREPALRNRMAPRNSRIEVIFLRTSL